LSHALTRDPKQTSDFLQRHGLRSVESKVQTKDLGFPLLQGRQNFFDRFGEGMFESLRIRAGVLRVRQIIEKLVVFTWSQRRIEGEMVL
jgi:hypothetical protein